MSIHPSGLAQRARLVLLVLPLLGFMTAFFFVPVGFLLVRAVQQPELPMLAPNFQRELLAWNGEGLPPPRVIETFREDLAKAQRDRRAAVIAKRLADIDPALREAVMKTAKIAVEESMPATSLLDVDPIWRNPAIWAQMRDLFAPFTDRYLLATMDLTRDQATGAIVAVAENEAIFVSTLARTISISLSVTLICLALGYPLAYVVVRQGPTMQALMLTFVMLPFWTSILVRSAAWLVLLQSHGLVNETLMSLSIVSEPLKLVYSRTGTILAMVHIQLPFTFLPIYSVMKSVPDTYTRAALSLGASPFKAFRRVYFPLTLPGVAAGCLLTFILSLGYYITPALVGGASDQMLSYYVAYYLNQSINWSMAAAVSLVLLVITLVIYVVYARFVPVLRQAEG